MSEDAVSESNVDVVIDSPSAAADAAEFHFQNFLISLPEVSAGDVFVDPSAEVVDLQATPSYEFALLLHEYIHFLQSISTVLGQRIILGWMEAATRIALRLKKQDPLVLPMNPVVRPSSEKAMKEWNAFMFEFAALVGAKHPLAPSEVTEGADPWTFSNYKYKHPSDGEMMDQVALIVGRAGQPSIGVPLLGDVFLEGQAQACQWLAEADDRSFAERMSLPLAEPRAADGRQRVYYTAVAELVNETLSGWDLCQTTILLCDIALCSRRPAVGFHSAYEELRRRTPVAVSEFPCLRRDLDSLPEVTEGARYIRERFDEHESKLQGVNSNSLLEQFRSLIAILRGVADRRQADPAFLFSADYSPGWLTSVLPLVGAPPIALARDGKNYFLSAQGDTLAYCFTLRGTHELAREIILHGLRRKKCPLMANDLCPHSSFEECESGRLLTVPFIEQSDGKQSACCIKLAANGMLLDGRKTRQNPHVPVVA